METCRLCGDELIEWRGESGPICEPCSDAWVHYIGELILQDVRRTQEKEGILLGDFDCPMCGYEFTVWFSTGVALFETAECAECAGVAILDHSYRAKSYPAGGRIHQAIDEED